ncbi:four helix bundle protein [Verrucomicrobiota bacterium]
MIKRFDHEHLRVYQASIDFVAWLEVLYPEIERKVSAHDHLFRASASVPVNIAEASGKSSMNERRQFIDTAYGSSLECAACLDVLCILECISPSMAQTGKRRLSGIVSMLIGFRESTAGRVREERVLYGTDNEGSQTANFDHEKLDVYRRAMDFIRWCDEFRKKQCLARSVEIALDRASTGLALNIAEGNGKFSTKDRCRFIGHARTAALQAAANLDVIAARNSQLRRKAEEGKRLLADSVRMLVAWQKSISGE